MSASPEYHHDHHHLFLLLLLLLVEGIFGKILQITLQCFILCIHSLNNNSFQLNAHIIVNIVDIWLRLEYVLYCFMCVPVWVCVCLGLCIFVCVSLFVGGWGWTWMKFSLLLHNQSNFLIPQ